MNVLFNIDEFILRVHFISNYQKYVRYNWITFVRKQILPQRRVQYIWRIFVFEAQLESTIGNWVDQHLALPYGKTKGLQPYTHNNCTIQATTIVTQTDSTFAIADVNFILMFDYNCDYLSFPRHLQLHQ